MKVDAGRWVVTARHLDTLSEDGRMPWGDRHARRSGDDRTACGEWAGGWPVFWHLPFQAATSATCHLCWQAVGRTRSVAAGR